MNPQAGNYSQFSSGRESRGQGRESEDAAREPGSQPETTQAERAAMHPERHDLEWGYYFTAWSH